MRDHIQPDKSLNPHARGHQEDRIHVGSILVFAVGLVAVVAVTMFAISLITEQFLTEKKEIFDKRPELFSFEDPDLYRGPRLQKAPGQDMANMRSQTKERLNSYGWVDPDKGVVHVPIDRAIELTLEQGLPVGSSRSEGESE